MLHCKGLRKVDRHGSALAPVYDLMKDALRPSETSEQTRMDKGTPVATRFYIVDEKAGTVRGLAMVVCLLKEKVLLMAVKSISKEVPKDLKHKVRALLT